MSVSFVPPFARIHLKKIHILGNCPETIKFHTLIHTNFPFVPGQSWGEKPTLLSQHLGHVMFYLKPSVKKLWIPVA